MKKMDVTHHSEHSFVFCCPRSNVQNESLARRKCDEALISHALFFLRRIALNP